MFAQMFARSKTAFDAETASARFVLDYQGFKWWAHQGSNLGPAD